MGAFLADEVVDQFSSIIAVIAKDPHLQNHCKLVFIYVEHAKMQRDYGHLVIIPNHLNS